MWLSSVSTSFHKHMHAHTEPLSKLTN